MKIKPKNQPIDLVLKIVGSILIAVIVICVIIVFVTTMSYKVNKDNSSYYYTET